MNQTALFSKEDFLERRQKEGQGSKVKACPWLWLASVGEQLRTLLICPLWHLVHCKKELKWKSSMLILTAMKVFFFTHATLWYKNTCARQEIIVHPKILNKKLLWKLYSKVIKVQSFKLLFPEDGVALFGTVWHS